MFRKIQNFIMFSTTWTNLTLLFLSLTAIHKKHVTIENPFICSFAHSPHLHADDTSELVTKEMKNRTNGHQKTQNISRLFSTNAIQKIDSNWCVYWSFGQNTQKGKFKITYATEIKQHSNESYSKNRFCGLVYNFVSCCNFGVIAIPEIF